MTNGMPCRLAYQSVTSAAATAEGFDPCATAFIPTFNGALESGPSWATGPSRGSISVAVLESSDPENTTIPVGAIFVLASPEYVTSLVAMIVPDGTVDTVVVVVLLSAKTAP